MKLPMPKIAMPKPRKHRKGLSLLEVLISIGIVSIGMMGVMLILPVAGYRAGQGALADSRSMNGLNWVDEFRARGMAQPANMIGPGVTATTVPAGAFLIDPQFVSRNPGVAFPYASNATIQMNRISLRTNPGGPALSPAATDQIFQSHDDLISNIPEDLDLPPQQETLLESNLPQKRASTGKVSWMAMLVAGAADTFRLSIIVMDSRDNDMPIGPAGSDPNDTSTDLIATERVSTVASMPGGGIRGGDVVLTTGTTTPVLKGALAVRDNDWLMLSANTPSGPIHQWYRVVSSDPEILGDTTAGFTRNVTLQGPDWPATAAPTPQVTIVTGVIGVFEKTIRLEEPSVWTVP